MITQFDKKKLGQRIRQIRVSKKMTQEELCSKLFIEPSMLSNYESGKTAPSINTLIKIVQALETTLDNIFDYEHFKAEEDLEKIFINEYKLLPIEKQRALYRFMQILKES